MYSLMYSRNHEGLTVDGRPGTSLHTRVLWSTVGYILLAALLMMAGLSSAYADKGGNGHGNNGGGGGGQASSCNVQVTNLEFGPIDLINASTNDAQAVLNYQCSANPGDQILLCVGMGPAPRSNGSMIPRYLVMDDLPTLYRLAFNLYTDPQRTQIWGNFGSTSGMTVPGFVVQMGTAWSVSGTQPVYGRIVSSGQTGLPSGPGGSPTPYDTDGGNLPVSFTYQVFTGQAPACGSGNVTINTASAYYISASISSVCRLNTLNATLDFGTVFQTLTQNTDGSTTLGVTCNGNPYSISLGYGLHANGQQRRMIGPNGGLLNYSLYLDPSRTQPWGNTPQTGYSGTGNGLPQSVPVYGRVPPQPVPAAGVYNDTVVVTVSY
ncbi:MAG TPA: spore coat U domain-containing protein [Castellaniella sp.]|uniref:Csu type fimbrial protein n=1 Tax=Castellaniella sp. TaxID=1955812 RepID=UPI002EECC1EE